MDIADIVGRWHAGHSTSGISRGIGVDRKTVRHYIREAEKAGLSRDGPLPERQALLAMLHPLVPELDRPRPAGGQFEAHREQVIDLVTRTLDPLKPKTAYEVLCHQHAITASYSSFKRFMRRLAPEMAALPTTCRIEVEPGSEIQIDYAKMGVLFDPVTERNRTVYVFAATLSHSRYKFLEFVHTQNQRSFVGSHVRMFAFFGGTATCLIIDNLKSGVLRPDHYDPELNPLYRELAEHYGTFIDTARVRRPTDKGKVERVVPLARELFRKLKTLHPKLDIEAANRLALQWCRTGNGMTVHGTTGEKPAEAFAAREQTKLGSLPSETFEVATWKKVKVHPDQFIQFEKKTFSVPGRFVGQTLWARGTERILTLYDLHYRQVKRHVRTHKMRHTDWGDFPEEVALMLKDGHVRHVIGQAAAIGPSMEAYVTRILEPHAKINLRKAQRIVGLVKNHSAETLEPAAATALEERIWQLKPFLRLLTDPAPDEDEAIPMSAETVSYVRGADYFIHQSNN